MTGIGQTRRPGRPRSEQSRQAVLTAARELLTDSGLPGLNMDDIARRAGVSKNTIYKWWPGKAAVVMEAFAEGIGAEMEFPAEGSAISRLRGQVRSVAHLMNDPRTRLPFVALVAASQHDPELGSALRERFIAVRRAIAQQAISEAVDRGEFKPDLDIDAMIDMIYGALYYRLLISGGPIDPAYADRIVDALTPALQSA